MAQVHRPQGDKDGEPDLSAAAAPPPGGPKPWDAQPGEPDLWYRRFGLYLQLGVGRSIEKCHRDCAELEGRSRGRSSRPGINWYAVARKWEWVKRARAWDAEQRDLLAACERDRRLDGRERRLALIDEYLTGAASVLAAANLKQVDQEQARALLPCMRLLFKDLILLHRGELELFTRDATRQQGDERPTITADDLRQAQRELDEWQAEMAGKC